MKKIMSYTLISFLLGFCLHASASEYAGAESDVWRVGVAKVNITPKECIWMGGYAFRDRPADGKITDLWAKALALEDKNGFKAVIITLDLVSIPKNISDEVRQKLNTELKLSKSQIIINSSHTHTGPVVSSEEFYVYKIYNNQQQKEKTLGYIEGLKNNLVRLVGDAFNNMQPAKLFSGNGITRFQVNRHTNVESELTGLTHLNGPNDYSVPVIKIAGENQKLIAVLFGYACHNTTLQAYQWSGDYAGFAQLELEKKYPGVTALFFQGAGGDQNPLPRGNVFLAKQYGEELAAAVQTVLKGEMKPLDNKLSATYTEIDLPFAKEPPTEEELEKIIADKSANAYPDYLKQAADQFLKTLRSGGKIMSSYPDYPVEVWNLGGQAIFILGGELTVGYTVDLKRIFGADIFVMGYSNDVMSYIPTAKMLGEGGYEVTMSPVFTTPYSSGIENKIISAAIEEAGKVGFYTSPVLSR